MFDVRYINKEPSLKDEHQHIVNFYPRHQCPLNIEPVSVADVCFGKACRSDCMWFGIRGMNEEPVCKFMEAYMKAWLK